MAFLSQRTRKNGKVWLVSFRLDDQRQRSIYLGDVTETQAKDSLWHIENLLRAKKINTDPKDATATWVSTLKGSSVRDSLVKHGLIASCDAPRIDAEQRKLKPFLQRCIDDMTDSKPATRVNYGSTRNWLLDYFTDDQLLTDITPSDMTRWQRHIKGKLGAVSNRNKHVQRAKRFMKTAVEDRLLKASPAAHLKFEAGKTDKSRQFFIDVALTKLIMDGLPDANWRMLFALMRWQGMRRLEAIELDWSEVDLAGNRLRFTSTKTGYRECPIFPETLPYILDAADLRGQQQAKVVKWHAGEDSVTPLLIKQVEKITKAKAWPKICINLRSTRRTELDDHFPGHVVSAWLGHSEKVAREHYQQVTAEHWDRASKQVSTQVSISGGQEGIRGVQSDTTESENSEKPEEKQHSIAVADSYECPRKDSNLGPGD